MPNNPTGRGYQPGRPFETDPDAKRVVGHDTKRFRHKERLLPDWIMFGVPHEDSVTVYASSNLSQVSLEQVATWFDELNRKRIAEGSLQPEPWTLYARMVGLFVGHGATYADAMADLQAKWRPDESGSTEQRQRLVSIAELQAQVEDDDVVDAEIVEE